MLFTLTYSSSTPLGRFNRTWPASIKVKGLADTEDREYCCKVLMVSKGAKMIFDEAAAMTPAKLFLMPLTHAASDLLGTAANFWYRILLGEAAMCGLLEGINDGILASTVVALIMSKSRERRK
jgi:hypothetical protein